MSALVDGLAPNGKLVIVGQSPRTPVLMLSVNESEELVRQVVAAGARGFVLKSDTGRDLVLAVDEIRQGRSFFSARLADFILRGYLRGGGAPAEAAPTASSTLTGREPASGDGRVTSKTRCSFFICRQYCSNARSPAEQRNVVWLRLT